MNTLDRFGAYEDYDAREISTYRRLVEQNPGCELCRHCIKDKQLTTSVGYCQEIGEIVLLEGNTPCEYEEWIER